MNAITDRYDTFPDWPQQLRSACEEERLADVAALLARQPPRSVVLYHWTETETDEGGLRSVTRTFESELLPFTAMATTPARERPEPLLPGNATQHAALLRNLLQESLTGSGPSCFWARSLACLRMVVVAGADVRAPGWMGLPLIVHVANLGQLEMLRFLVESKGADVGARRKRGGYGTLHWASGVETLRYLLEQGADPSMRTDDGDSVVAQQVRLGHAEEVAWLLAREQPMFARDDALRWIGADPDLVRALLRAGVDGNQVLPAIFGEDHDTLLLHRVLRDGLHKHMGSEDLRSREDAAERLIACVDLALEHGFDASREDGIRTRPFHIVRDHRDLMDPDLHAALNERLQRYDGPRRSAPEGRRCTCGLRL